MRELAVLNDAHAHFVSLVSEKGLSFEEAAVRSGYTEDYGRKLCRNPSVAAAIHASIQVQLQTDIAPLALTVARVILADANAPTRVRADLSMKLLDRAGHIVPSNKQKAPDKALSEMTQAELLEFIDRNQAEIDKAEGELAAAARDVSAPAIAPKEQGLDAKPLNYLD